MNKYYTSQGDDGTTITLGKGRVPKYHPRIEAVGSIDEASAALGLARAQADHQEINQIIQQAQRDLYRIMPLMVIDQENPDKFPDLEPERVTWLEEQIQIFGDQEGSPGEFILPGGSLPSAAFSVARTVVRRAERQAVRLADQGLLHSQNALPYLNRLSSLCYVLELYLVDHRPTLAKDPS